MDDESITSNKTITTSSSSSQSDMENSNLSLLLFFNIQSIMSHYHLNNVNYINWSSLFTSVLDTHRLSSTITQRIPPPKLLEDGETENPAYDFFFQASDLVLVWIKAMATAEIQTHVNPCKTDPMHGIFWQRNLEPYP